MAGRMNKSYLEKPGEKEKVKTDSRQRRPTVRFCENTLLKTVCLLSYLQRLRLSYVLSAALAFLNLFFYESIRGLYPYKRFSCAVLKATSSDRKCCVLSVVKRAELQAVVCGA